VETGDENEMYCNEKLCFRLSDIQKVQCFRNGSVHEFYGLKASQMSKVRASLHEYPDVEKIKNLWNRISKSQAYNNQLDYEATSVVNI